MQKPLQVTFRDMEHSDAVMRAIQDKAADLETFSSHIISCDVAIETPHERKHRGNLYRCRINIRVPGSELVVGRSPDRHGAHEDVYVAIRDSFKAARRELQDYERRRRQDVKVHVGPPHGVITRLFPNEGNGFLTKEDGTEVFFHQNSVIGDFDDLELGMEVRFSEEMGTKGPQASSLTPVGKSGHVAMAKPATHN